MKRLQNSDLNKKEGSFDILKAICNESDEYDENYEDRNDNDIVQMILQELKDELKKETDTESETKKCAIEGGNVERLKHENFDDDRNDISPTITTRKFGDQTMLRLSESDILELKRTFSLVHKLIEQHEEYQSQIKALNEKLKQTEMQAQHTLEIMQVECDDVKMKMIKKALEQVANEKKNNLSKLNVRKRRFYIKNI